jgi:MFS family permease
MEENNWQALRESGFRVLFVGAFSLVIAFIIYSQFTTPSSEPLRVESEELTGLAWGMLAISGASMASMVYGAYIIFRSEQIRTTTTTLGAAKSLISFITAAFSNRNYWKIMIVAAVGYGIFFGFLSQILVYRADVSFTERGIEVPSVDLIPCCGAVGYMPMLTIYITDHFLILIIPLNVILATIVSLLVGFNVALSIYAFRMKKLLQTKTSLAAGIGATSGLFVGCPTCAGSLISALLGIGIAGAGGTSASVLAPFQTLFIAASIPALVVAPFLTARSIRSASSCNIR